MGRQWLIIAMFGLAVGAHAQPQDLVTLARSRAKATLQILGRTDSVSSFQAKRYRNRVTLSSPKVEIICQGTSQEINRLELHDRIAASEKVSPGRQPASQSLPFWQRQGEEWVRRVFGATGGALSTISYSFNEGAGSVRAMFFDPVKKQQSTVELDVVTKEPLRFWRSQSDGGLQAVLGPPAWWLVGGPDSKFDDRADTVRAQRLTETALSRLGLKVDASKWKVTILPSMIHLSSANYLTSFDRGRGKLHYLQLPITESGSGAQIKHDQVDQWLKPASEHASKVWPIKSPALRSVSLGQRGSISVVLTDATTPDVFYYVSMDRSTGALHLLQRDHIQQRRRRG